MPSSELCRSSLEGEAAHEQDMAYDHHNAMFEPTA